jgi:uncharacterized protein (DUF4213/DUF364 family)
MRLFEALCAQVLANERPDDPRTIRQVYLPEPAPDSNRATEFGLLELDDGSVGLYYAWLGEGQAGMAERYARQLPGRRADTLLAPHAVSDIAARSLAVAALNALTASAWRRVGYQPPAAIGGFGLQLKGDGPLGMVGNFAPLVRQARAQGTPVVVLERKAHMWQHAEGLTITSEIEALAPCRQILCTAATLLNDTLDEVLAGLPSGVELALVGPTAGMFPDRLFARGFSVVAGTAILDGARALARLKAGEPLGDAALKYALDVGTYPGTEALLAR